MATNTNFYRPAANVRTTTTASQPANGQEPAPMRVVIEERPPTLFGRIFGGVKGLFVLIFGALTAIGTLIPLIDRGVIQVPDAVRQKMPFLEPPPPAPAVPADVAMSDVVKVLGRLTELQGRSLFARRKLASSGRGTEEAWRPMVANSANAVAQGAGEVLAALRRARQFDRASVTAALDKVAAQRDAGTAEERAMLVARFEQWTDLATIQRDTEQLGELHLRRKGASPTP